jgi:TubC N-terminal docking domain
MTPLELLTTLHGLGVTLTPWVDRLRVDAPAGVLTDDLRQALRTHKTALLDLVEAFEERAAIAEYCGGLVRTEAEALAWAHVLGEEAASALPMVQVAP